MEMGGFGCYGYQVVNVEIKCGEESRSITTKFIFLGQIDLRMALHNKHYLVHVFGIDSDEIWLQ